MIEYNLKFSKKDNDLIIKELKSLNYDINDIENSLKKYILHTFTVEKEVEKILGIKYDKNSFIVDDIPSTFDEIFLLNKISNDHFLIFLHKKSIEKRDFCINLDIFKDKEVLFDLLLKDISKYINENNDKFISINDKIYINKNKIENKTSNVDTKEIEVIFKKHLGSYKLPPFNTSNDYDFANIQLNNIIEDKFKLKD